MNQPEPAICHCLIAHPTSAKFLIIKHADGWSPPVAVVAEDVPLVNLPNEINQGMLKNYGFITAGLRQLASAPGYRCIEMDWLSQHGREGLQAYWVGKKEYERFRRSASEQFDPMAAWLDEKENGEVPANRPPWEKAGWFAEARSWIQDGLRQLNIQQDGPVEQVRAFRTASCILRVPISRGHIYFKASNGTTPPEAEFTRALARDWPGQVEMPLLVDTERNWMLTRDFSYAKPLQPGYADFSAVARSLAELQLQSSQSLARWSDLGCDTVSLDTLERFATDLESLEPLLRMGGGDMALSDAEVESFLGLTEPLSERLDRLRALPIPDMLVHPDLWFTNIRFTDQGVRFFDWADTVIAHPFFSFVKLYRFRELEKENELEPRGEPGEESAFLEECRDEYLASFSEYGSEAERLDAFEQVCGLHSLWRLHHWRRALEREESMSVNYQVVVRHIQRIARAMA